MGDEYRETHPMGEWSDRKERVLAATKRRANAAERERDRMRAVVEAARAWAEWRMGYGGTWVHRTEDALFDAVQDFDGHRSSDDG